MSVSSPSEGVYAVAFPEKLSRRWLPRNVSEWIMFVILGLAYMNVSKFYPDYRILAAVAALTLVTPLLYERVYATIGVLQDLYIKYILKDVLHEAGDTSFRARLRPAVPIPGIVDALDKDGLLYDEDADSDYAYVLGDGSDLLSKSFEEQGAIYQKVASMIRSLASSYKLDVGIGWLLLVRPLDQRQLDLRMQHNLHPGVYSPVALDPKRPIGPLTRDEATNLELHKVQQDRYQEQMDNEADVTMALVLNIKRPAALKAAAKKEEIDYREEARLPIRQLLTQAIESLGSIGVENPRVVSADDLKRMQRKSHDVFTLDEYYALSPEEQLDPRNYGPQDKIVVKHDACLVGDTWSASVMISGGPAEMPLYVLRDMFSARVEWLSFGAPSETTSFRNEYTFINFVLTPFSIAIRGGFGIVRSSEGGLAKERSREERQRHLYYTRWSQRIAMVLSAHAASYDEVVEEARRLEARARELGLSSVRIKGRRRQLRALWTATTCCKLL
jgi:hypothetical protein